MEKVDEDLEFHCQDQHQDSRHVTYKVGRVKVDFY